MTDDLPLIEYLCQINGWDAVIKTGPHAGTVVKILKVDGDTLTVEPKDPKEFDFAVAELHRRDVRILDE